MTDGTQVRQAMKLLPCPFCGATEPKVNILEQGYDAFVPYCDNCEATTDPWFSTKEEAAAAWNRRAIPQPPVGASVPRQVEQAVRHATYWYDVDHDLVLAWLERQNTRAETASALSEVAKAAGATLRSITWSDEDSNADRYYRGFNDGHDFAINQHGGIVPTAIAEAIDMLCKVNEYHSAARLLRAWLRHAPSED